jgi:hypothetical protein
LLLLLLLLLLPLLPVAGLELGLERRLVTIVAHMHY